MEQLMALVIGGLYAGGIYLMLRRSIAKLLIGLSLLGHAANLLIFTSAGLTRGGEPLVPPGRLEPIPPSPDPLAQALVLTAIVISFGLLAFTIALAARVHAETRSDDLDELRPRR